MTRILILGGTRHVGRAAVEHALALGWEVTAVNRGIGRSLPDGVTFARADRTVPGDLERALAEAGAFDLVVDTWSRAPRIVQDSTRLLADRTPCYAYVSSISVYTWPWASQSDESEPVVDADPSADLTDYAADKRGSELAVLDAFGTDRCLLARAGLILGPYEQVGRLPWWLHRLAEGGEVIAPGPRERPLQYIDGRDLAAWLVEAPGRGARGTVNTVGPVGMTTMGDLLDTAVSVTGSTARLRWLTPEEVAEAGWQPWTELPIWTPPEGEWAAVHDVGTRRAAALGLTCRPMPRTVEDTWEWLQSEGYPETVFDGSVGSSPDAAR
ncbi:MAG: NAD-dependent epimerase/dehydratase family protein [Actinomycetales bacterium]|nr:NAD-dependent epimerase/dehydratase family protein [Actinomycetales bacterium]